MPTADGHVASLNIPTAAVQFSKPSGAIRDGTHAVDISGPIPCSARLNSVKSNYYDIQ